MDDGQKPLRMLLLEDNLDDVEILKDELRRAGISAICSHVDTETAYIAQLDPPPDLILADFTLPGFDALGALELLHERDLDVPLIVVTGQVTEEVAVACIHHGAVDYLLKDRLGRLGPAVRRALAERAAGVARRQTMRALGESERRFRALVLNTSDTITVLAREGTFQYVGPTAKGLTGTPPEKLLGSSIFDYIHPDDIPLVRSTLDRLGAEAGATASVIYRLKRVDGSWIAVESVGQSLLTDPAVGGLVFHTRDITERQHAERTRSHLAAIVESSDDAIISLALDGTITSWNRGAEQLYGYTAAEAIARSLSLIVPNDRLDEVPKILGRIRRGASVPHYETVRQRKDGTCLEVSLTISPIRDPNGQVVGAAVMGRDITERKRIEQEVARAREQLEYLFDNLDAVFFLMDLTNPHLSRVSAASNKVYGYPPEAFVEDRDFHRKLVHPDDRDFYDDGTRTNLAGRVAPMTYRIRRSDGTIRWVESTIKPIFDPTGCLARVYGVTSDVTARRDLEEQLRRAQKLEAIGQLAGGIAHDFNNLLTVISGFGELVHGRLASDAPERAMLEQVLRAGESATALTRQLLLFSRHQVVEMRDVDLNSVIESMGKMLRRLIGEEFTISTALTSPLGVVRADPGQIEQILLNLVTNARDAMPAGGGVTIATANVDLDDAYVSQHPEARPGPHVLLTVTDCGLGMDAVTRARIFEPFFTTKKAGKGTGLGLAVVYGIVKHHNGSIAVLSEPGRGSTFQIYLPCIDGASAATVTTSGDARSSQGTETIVAVEDSSQLRHLVKVTLESSGYRVFEAASGEDALQLVKAFPSAIHLLLTDVIMPGLNGRELAEMVRGRWPGVRVLFMSGYTDDTVLRHGIIEEGVSFLQKPFTPTSLVRKVREVLDAEAR